MTRPPTCLFRPLRAVLCALLLAGCSTPGTRQDFSSQLVHHPEQGIVVPRVPDYPATDMRAANSTLADVLAYWNPKIMPDEVDRLFRSHLEAAGELTSMALVAQEKGCWTHIGKGSPETLKERLRAGIPVLIDLPIDPRKEKWRRLSVVVGYDDGLGRYLCHEGRVEPVTYTYAGLERLWQGTGYWMMIVCPPERATWELTWQELLSRGRYHDSQNRLAEAEEDLQRASKLRPDDSGIQISEANIRLKRGDPAGAEAHYRSVLDKDPLDSRALNNLAYLLADQGRNLPEAEELAHRAVLREPTNPRTLDTLGLIHLKKEELKKSIHYFEQARARSRKLTADEQDQIAMHLAQAYHAAGHDELAYNVVEEIRRHRPDIALPDELRDLKPAETSVP